MQEEMTKIIKNSQGQTVGAVVETELGKLGYDREKIVNYSFLIEEALIEWREKLPADSDLIIKRVDKGSNVFFSVSIEGEKVDPFYIDPSEMDDLSVMKYHDKLLSGVGSELRYKYSKGSDKNGIIFHCDYVSCFFTHNLNLLRLLSRCRDGFSIIASRYMSKAIIYLWEQYCKRKK